MSLKFEGVYADILNDTTPEVAVIGGRNSAKTTTCIEKILRSAKKHAGIWIWAFRYSDNDTKTKLRPDLERLCSIRNESPHWNSTELAYEFENDSKIFCYGLKSIDLLSRYSKMRGLAVSQVLCSQAEEVTEDLAEELRLVLRPNPTQVSRGQDFPRQLIFEGQPVPKRHWLALQFPENNSIKHRKYYRLSIYDNPHLPPEVIAQAEATFPPGHPRHASMILGMHGPNITGKAIYEGLFTREKHIRPIDGRDGQLIEAFCAGKNNPCWVIAQRTRSGALQFLGGIIGADLFLTDFLPIVKDHRKAWFGDADIKTCASPVGAQDDPNRLGDIQTLRAHGFKSRWCENSNAPDVRLSMVEHLGELMRQESLAVNDNPQRWLEASREGIKPCPFLAEGFEVGYVKDEHFSSVSHKEIRQPKADDWFEMGMRCAEYLMQNFCAGKLSDAERAKRASAQKHQPREHRQRGEMDYCA